MKVHFCHHPVPEIPNLCLRFFRLRRINNAGEVTAKRLLADVEATEVVRVVGTNVLGSLLG